MKVTASVPGEYRYYLLSTGKSVGTIRQRLGDMDRFARTRSSLFDVVTGDLVAYLGRGADYGRWSLEYLKKIRSSFRSFYRWAHKSGLIDVDPAYELDPIRIPRPLPHPTPEVLVRAALHVAPVPVRAMLLLAATEGLRRTEIAGLHPKHRVGDTIRFTGKGARDRVVPLDELTYGLLLALEALQGRDVFYFPGRFGGHLHDSTVYRKVTELTPGWTLHSLRHRAATAAYAGTHDLRATQEMLGHASPATTQIYTAISLGQIRSAITAASLA